MAQAGFAPPAERGDWRSIASIVGIVVLMNVCAWLLLAAIVVPQHLTVGTEVFGYGLGLTAYTLGMRHAFDADHIAAIDNTTRKLMADGKRPVSVGFWFALGHSAIVVLLAVLIAVGAGLVHSLTSAQSGTHRVLSVVGTSASGLFLYLIGIFNLIALFGIIQVYRQAKRGQLAEDALEEALAKRGLITRLLRPVMAAVRSPIQMFGVGALFGVGFDTATEVTLLVLAGAGAAGGLPWYAIVAIPLLFASGMSLLDTLDGAFMTIAYRWAFAHPIRKIYYNLTITGLSVAVALLIGTIELTGVLHDQFGLHGGISDWIVSLNLNDVGFVIVAIFIVVWVLAIVYWRVARVELRWSAREAANGVGSGELSPRGSAPIGSAND